MKTCCTWLGNDSQASESADRNQKVYDIYFPGWWRTDASGVLPAFLYFFVRLPQSGLPEQKGEHNERWAPRTVSCWSDSLLYQEIIPAGEYVQCRLRRWYLEGMGMLFWSSHVNGKYYGTNKPFKWRRLKNFVILSKWVTKKVCIYEWETGIL